MNIFCSVLTICFHNSKKMKKNDIIYLLPNKNNFYFKNIIGENTKFGMFQFEKKNSSTKE